MDLEELGWNKHFQRHFDEIAVDGIIAGRISKVSTSYHYRVITDKGDRDAVISGKLKNKTQTGAELPTIGDWVLITKTDVKNIIVKVLERKNSISRKVAGRSVQEQVVGANIDIVFIVMGLDNDFNLRRLERYLFMVISSGIEPVVLLNKKDLVTDNDLARLKKNVKEVSGNVPVHLISGLNRESLSEILDYTKKGTTATLVGSSGAGKSTIINALMNNEVQPTGKVRSKDDKGRHVTTSRELFGIPGGGVLIDNPGIRELQLWGDPSALDDVFDDIHELSLRCRFKNCQHDKEPGCAVKEAVKDGSLTKKRYDNYQKMKKELAYLEKKRSIGSEAVKRAKWKGLTNKAKNYKRYKMEGQ